MSVQQRAELEAQLEKLRQSISAARNEQDKFGLMLKLKGIEEHLAALRPHTGRSMSPEQIKPEDAGDETRPLAR
jgi:hypothetical protein